MKDNDKVQKKLNKELVQLRSRIAELEASGRKRNQFEDALRLERDKAQQYLDIAEVILVALNKKGEITLINRKGNQILGYKEGELLGKNWFTTCVPLRLRKKIKSGFMKLMAGEIKLTEFYENPVLTKSGTEKIIAWHNSLLKDAQGNNIGTLSSGEDITERKQGEKEIERLSFFPKLNPMPIVDFDQKGRLAFANPAAKHLFPDLDKKQGEHPFVVGLKPYFPELRKKRKKYIVREVRVGDDWYSQVIVLVDPEHIRIYSADITERKQAEEALRESEATLGAFINAPTDSVLLLDPRGTILDINEIAAERLGKSRDALIGTLADDSLPKDIAKKRRSMISQILETGREVRFEDERAGIWYDTVAHPITDNDGMISRVAIIARDITERKKAEKELLESGERYRLLFEEARDGIALADADTGILLDCNQALADLVGRNRAELIGQHQAILHPPSGNNTGISATFKKHLTNKEGQVLETQVLTVAGEIREAEIKANLLYLHGRKMLQGIFRDITERKKAEEALHKSEEKYRTILENIEEGYYEVDLAGNFTFFNDAMCRIWGYSKEELMGMNNRQYTDKENAKRVFQAFNEVYKTGKPGTVYDYEIIKKDGTRRYVETSISLQKDSSGKAIGFRGIIRDITERRQTEEALRDSRHLLQTVLDSIPSAVFWKNRDSIYLGGNRTWLESVGLKSLEAVVGKSDYDLPWGKEQADSFREDDRRVMESGIPGYGIIEPYRRADGTFAWAMTNKVPLRDTKGNVVGVLGTYEDITERKRAEEALEESEKKYRQVVENATDIIYTTDINGNFKFANSIALKVTGYSLAELQRVNYLDLVVPEYRDQLKEIYGNQFRARQATTYVEFPFSNKFGEVMWFGQNASLIIEGGRIIGFQVISRDISERKQAEKALHESEEKYRDLVENISDIIYATDESGIVTYISPTIESISGYVASEIVGRSFLEFVYQEDMSDVVQFFQQDISGHAVAHEYRMVTKAGDVRWARTSSRPFFEGDRIVGLRGILTDITERKQAEEEIKRGYEQLQETLHSTVKALASTVEMKDQYTAGHQPRVTQLACAIAEEMGLSEDQIEGIRMAASIHDIGKIMVPAEILNKPGPLSEIQYEMIKMHPRAGYDILKGLKLPWPVAQIILQHHERQDGSGYPQGLSREEIMVEARILAVANVVEAMNAHRPYRPAYDIKEALAEISKNRGAFYDATVVDACLRLFTEKGFTLAPVPR